MSAAVGQQSRPPDAMTAEFLMAMPWRLYTPEGKVAADSIQFLLDGSIRGYHNVDEAGWVIDQGLVCFTTREGEITTRFAQQSTERIRLVLRGDYRGHAGIALAIERRGWSKQPPDRLTQLGVFTGFDPAVIDELGLSYEIVRTTFFGNRYDAPLDIVAQAPPGAAGRITADCNASSFVFSAMRRDATVADVFTGEPVRCDASLTRDNQGEMLYGHLPFFYRFHSPSGQTWWVVSHSVTGCPALLYLPDSAAVISRSEYSPETVRIMIRELEIAAELEVAGSAELRSIVAVVDMLDAHGHQLINQLPGVQRLIDEFCVDHVDEVWVTGTEFFGPLADIFPEFAGKVRRFHSRWQVAAALSGGNIIAFGIGSALLQARLIERLRKTAARRATGRQAVAPRSPLVAFTVRSNGRVCRNLVDVAVQCVAVLLPRFPGLRIVTDGWVLAESLIVAQSPQFTLWDNHFYRHNVHEEFEVVRALASELPPGVLARNLIGETMLASIDGLQDIAAYVAHVGTLQHKLSFLSGARGLIHGPVEQLKHPELGHYTSQIGHAPVILDPAAVFDIEMRTERGARFNDYWITDIDAIVRPLEAMLEAWQLEQVERLAK